MSLSVKTLALAIFAAMSLAAPAMADDQVVKLTIKDHRFIPDRLEVLAKTKLVLVIRNEDAEPEEFESKDLRREKIVHPGTETRLVLGKLDPGEYSFVGEYHEATAKGVIVAK
jgi:plastocyanin